MPAMLEASTARNEPLTEFALEHGEEITFADYLSHPHHAAILESVENQASDYFYSMPDSIVACLEDDSWEGQRLGLEYIASLLIECGNALAKVVDESPEYALPRKEAFAWSDGLERASEEAAKVISDAKQGAYAYWESQDELNS
tara:strand:+ start:2802 stop:3233 length:432 start_codon:yes stop_codon:yes gene_type:complete